MKLIILVSVTLASACFAQLDRSYLPPIRSEQKSSYPGNHDDHSESASFGESRTFNTPENFGGAVSSHSNFGNLGAPRNYGSPNQSYGVPSRPERYSAPERYRNSADSNAIIMQQESELTSNGFKHSFEADNGIKAEARGIAEGGVRSKGSFGYKSDDGKDYSVRYTADENGYRPEGAHLPTPPSVPEDILQSLQQNAREESNGNFRDGFYNKQRYMSKDNGYSHSNAAGSGRYFGLSNSGSFSHIGSPSTSSQSYQPFSGQQNGRLQPGKSQRYNEPSTFNLSQQSGKLSYLPPNRSPSVNTARYNAGPSPQFSGSQPTAASHQQFKPTSINSQLEGSLNSQFGGSFPGGSSPDFGASSLYTQYGTHNTFVGSAQDKFLKIDGTSVPPLQTGTGAAKFQFARPNSFGSQRSPSQYNAPGYHGSQSEHYKSPNTFGSAPSNQYSRPKSQFEVSNSFGGPATSTQYGAFNQPQLGSSGSQRGQFGGPRDPPSFSPDSGYKY